MSNWYGGTERVVEIASATAIWYSTGLPAVPLGCVLIRDPQEEKFNTQALLCTDLDADPERIISWFVRRWQMETTFQEVRQRLGFETQRHWSERGIQRTAPALLGLFSVVALLAHRYMAEGEGIVRGAAWYDKRHPTFSDALAVVRRELWSQEAAFLRVDCGERRSKSLTGIHRKANRRGLLCSVMAKVQLRNCPKSPYKAQTKALRADKMGQGPPTNSGHMDS